MDPVAPLIDSLHAEGRLRVWSLLITIFGDSVHLRGGRISTARLQTLLQRIGVESGTLRTALSRLSRDGWVSSTRVGKSSLYQLNPKGLADFADASNRIYAPPSLDKTVKWSIGTTPSRDAVSIGGLWLQPAGKTTLAKDFEIVGTLERLSPQQRNALTSTSHHTNLKQLFCDLDALYEVALAPLDAAAASMLLIHRWRRLILRFPDIPPELMPKDIGPRNARAEVAKAYQNLTKSADVWWNSCDNGLTAMPVDIGKMNQRFAHTDKP